MKQEFPGGCVLKSWVNTLHSLQRACSSCHSGSALWLYRSSNSPKPVCVELASIIMHTKCEKIWLAPSSCFTMHLASECVCDVIHSFSYSAGGPGLMPVLGGYRSVYFCRLAGTWDFLWVYCGWSTCKQHGPSSPSLLPLHAVSSPSSLPVDDLWWGQPHVNTKGPVQCMKTSHRRNKHSINARKRTCFSCSAYRTYMNASGS